MSESHDQGPEDRGEPPEQPARQAPGSAAIPLLPRVTPAPEPTPLDDVSTTGAVAERATESVVRMPRRQRSGAPVPWAMRKGGETGPVRSWTPLGTVDSGSIAEIDPAGMVHLAGRDWSLDWWIRAEDRWHHPSMEAGATHSAQEACPVLRTAVRVPGGEVVQLGTAAQLSTRTRGDGGSFSAAGVVTQVTNGSAVPVALALVLRPYRLDAEGRLESVELLGSSVAVDDRATAADGSRRGVLIRVNDSDLLHVDQVPARVAHGTPGEVTSALGSGSDQKLDHDEVSATGLRWDVSSAGALEVAFVFPLSHTTTLSAALVPAPVRTPRRRPFSRNRAIEPVLPVSAPGVSSVLRGWQLHAEEDPAIAWVAEAAGDFVAWSSDMLRIAAPGAVTRALDPTTHDGALPVEVQLGVLCRGLGSLPAGELHMAVADALVHAQRFSGCVEPRGSSDATIALAWVAAAVLRSDLRAKYCDELIGPVAKALSWLSRSSADRMQFVGEDQRNRIAADQALRQLAAGLVAVGQPELAELALTLAAETPGDALTPDVGPPDDGPPGVGRPGVGRLDVGRPDDEVTHRLITGLPTAMPGAHVDTGASRRSRSGFDIVEVAELRNELLNAVVADAAPGPALFVSWRADWNGHPLEVHRVPTAWGRVSAAVRWHGSNPALLWDVQPWLPETDGPGVPVITAPGLSPGWSATGWSGESLLAL